MNANYGYTPSGLDPFASEEDEYQRLLREELERQRALRAPMHAQAQPQGPTLPNFFASLAGRPASTLNAAESDAAQRASLGAMSDSLLRFVENGGWYSSTLADMNAARRGVMAGAEEKAAARQAALVQSELAATDDAERVAGAAVTRGNFFETRQRQRTDQARQESDWQRADTERAQTAEGVADLLKKARELQLSPHERALAEGAAWLPSAEGLKVLQGVIADNYQYAQTLERDREAERRQVERDRVNFQQQRQLMNERPQAASAGSNFTLKGMGGDGLEAEADEKAAEVILRGMGLGERETQQASVAAARFVLEGKAKTLEEAARMIESGWRLKVRGQ